MEAQQHINYQRIAEAITYIQQHFKRQPSLEEVAEKVHLSPFHFQRLFKEWAGTTPKKFLQYVSVEHAKTLLHRHKATLFETAFETGLSGTSRLHDLFVALEAMTPAEYKNGGRNLTVNHDFVQTPFGSLLVASTAKGVCHMAFDDEEETAFKNLHAKFPNARFSRRPDGFQQAALGIFQKDWSRLNGIRLHLKGTDFQLKVWQALLSIPLGGLSTYQAVARQIQRPGASRAVGTAVGSNPVAYLIPCHRVIQASGSLKGYKWGDARKTAIVGWEMTRYSLDNQSLADMKITNCTPADADFILALYEAARILQSERNVVQWPFFEKAFIETEIAEKRQWKLAIEGEIACNWVVAYEDKDIWEEKEKGDAVYLHRISTPPGHRGNNLIEKVVAWAKQHARENNKRYVRLDTLGNNTRLIKHYTRAGFTFLGIVRLADTTNLPGHYQQEPDCCLFELSV